jgi:AAA family ATP:ADP antiporter
MYVDPNRMYLHPNAAADLLTTLLPQFFYPLIAIFRNWTYALFYMLANLWVRVCCCVVIVCR